MVAQSRYHVEQYVRQPDGAWLFREYKSPEDTLRLAGLDGELPLAEIYYQVEMGGEG